MSIRTMPWVGCTAAFGATLALMISAAPAQAAPAGFPTATFYTGADQAGTAQEADLDAVGTCQTLAQPALSYTIVSDRDVDVFFNTDCRTGAPDTPGDLYYRTGTFNQGNFPYPAVSYRVRSVES
ncbi:hypothetical protein ACWD04_26715 [Streptomyces sp. NPDC002911]